MASRICGIVSVDKMFFANRLAILLFLWSAFHTAENVKVLFEKVSIRQQAFPLTVTVLGRPKSVTVIGELLTVSLYPNICIV